MVTVALYSLFPYAHHSPPKITRLEAKALALVEKLVNSDGNSRLIIVLYLL